MSEPEAGQNPPAPPPLLGRLIDIRAGEAPAVALSFLYFLFVLAAYYTLRPLRDAMAVAAGVENIQYLFLSTFVTMLAIVPVYGWIVSRVPRRRLLPLMYAFFILNILGFRGWFAGGESEVWLARVFFVWVSVFNLFVVSVFWSFMADFWRTGQARRLYGLIAAGGSIGAVLGPAITARTVQHIGQANLLLISALLLGAALVCLVLLIGRLGEGRSRRESTGAPMGGEVLAGARLVLQQPFLAWVAAFMFLGTLTGVMLYLQQVNIVDRHFDTPESVTRVFASVDFAVNLLTIAIQLTLTARIVGRLGLALTLALLPVIATVGFGAITFLPTLAVIVSVQVLRRATLFAITNPASQMIYTVVGPQSKYKFKYFVDTVVYRAGDTTGAWLFAGVLKSGLGLAAAAGVGMLLSLFCTAVGLRVGRDFRTLRESDQRLP